MQVNCPTCHAPTHASESTDCGRCVPCAVKQYGSVLIDDGTGRTVEAWNPERCPGCSRWIESDGYGPERCPDCEVAHG